MAHTKYTGTHSYIRLAVRWDDNSQLSYTVSMHGEKFSARGISGPDLDVLAKQLRRPATETIPLHWLNRIKAIAETSTSVEHFKQLAANINQTGDDKMSQVKQSKAQQNRDTEIKVKKGSGKTVTDRSENTKSTKLKAKTASTKSADKPVKKSETGDVLYLVGAGKYHSDYEAGWTADRKLARACSKNHDNTQVVEITQAQLKKLGKIKEITESDWLDLCKGDAGKGVAKLITKLAA